MVNGLLKNRQVEHWLMFIPLDGDADMTVTISYYEPFDLNDNEKVDAQVYRAGRRLKRRLNKHPCSRTPKLHLFSWSDSFDDASLS